MRLSKFIMCGIFIGCSYSDPYIPEHTSTVLEDITLYDYKYYSGHNAAVEKFGEQYSDLLVDLKDKRVISYTSDSSNDAYADGYHKAIQIIDSRNNTKCSHFH